MQGQARELETGRGLMPRAVRGMSCCRGTFTIQDSYYVYSLEIIRNDHGNKADSLVFRLAEYIGFSRNTNV